MDKKSNYLVWLQYVPRSWHRTLFTSPTLTNPFFINSDSWIFNWSVRTSSCSDQNKKQQTKNTRDRIHLIFSFLKQPRHKECRTELIQLSITTITKSKTLHSCLSFRQSKILSHLPQKVEMSFEYARASCLSKKRIKMEFKLCQETLRTLIVYINLRNLSNNPVIARHRQPMKLR